jgi:hypothetical protein
LEAGYWAACGHTAGVIASARRGRDLTVSFYIALPEDRFEFGKSTARVRRQRRESAWYTRNMNGSQTLLL